MGTWYDQRSKTTKAEYSPKKESKVTGKWGGGVGREIFIGHMNRHKIFRLKAKHV